MIEKFEIWYASLSESQKEALLKHILNNKITPINEGFFSGPAGPEITKGLFSGPISSKNICPTCKRPR